jgi:hypothetical protein
MASAGQGWRPTTFLRFEIALDTSMGTARLVTDAGPAYIKALGNRQGPHPLACEWVGTQVARWFMVELGQHCHTHIIPRLKKVIDGQDPGAVTEATGCKRGGGFRYYTLALSLLQKDRWGQWVRRCARSNCNNSRRTSGANGPAAQAVDSRGRLGADFDNS